jgi:hypothetical protein
MTYRAFPPGRGHLKIPTYSKKAARAGLAMYAPCRTWGILARSVGWHTVGLLGAWALPGRPTKWSPPMPETTWSELRDVWSRATGPFDGLAVYERPQVSRAGVAFVLLRRGEPVAFVKAREGASDPVANEFLALEAVSAYEPATFSVPTPVATGAVAGWHYLVTSVLTPELHRMPSNPPLDQITGEIADALADLTKSPETPAHWRPMHGDFTPWNLRQRADGSLFLVDWEDAEWAPPGADALLYRVVAAQLANRPAALGSSTGEAREFWIARLRNRQEHAGLDRDAGLGASLVELLQR